MAATVTQLRDAIAAKVGSVAGVGVVHSYERYAATIAKFRELYVADDQVRGWYVRRVATDELSPGEGRYVLRHQWEIRGYMALADANATEVAFDTLIEAIRDAFRADDTLGGLVGTCQNEAAAGVQVIDSGPVLFAGVLCHGCRLRLFTIHAQ